MPAGVVGDDAGFFVGAEMLLLIAGFFVGLRVGLRVGGLGVGGVGVVGTAAPTLVHFPKLPKVAVVRLLTVQQSRCPDVAHL